MEKNPSAASSRLRLSDGWLRRRCNLLGNWIRSRYNEGATKAVEGTLLRQGANSPLLLLLFPPTPPELVKNVAAGLHRSQGFHGSEPRTRLKDEGGTGILDINLYLGRVICFPHRTRSGNLCLLDPPRGWSAVTLRAKLKLTRAAAPTLWAGTL